MKKILLPLLVSLAACAGETSQDATDVTNELAATPQSPVDDSAALTVDHEAVLNFMAGYSEVLTNAPIYAGGRCRVVYDASRLPTCRGTNGSQQGWNITLNYRQLPDQTVQTAVLTSAGVYLSATLQVVESATGLEMWFVNTNDKGCKAYDSNQSKNYRYEVSVPQQVTRVVFDRQWNETAEGAILQRGVMRLVYDPSRLPSCRALYNGARTWSIYASWRFLPGGQTGTVSMFDGVGAYEGEDKIGTPDVAVPADATAVELWFSSSDRAGCKAWDSNFGHNYRFEVVPPADAAPAVGWAGDIDFVIAYGNGDPHYGDRDPAYYWNNMDGAPASSRMEVQVWIPKITDVRYASEDAARTAAESRVTAQAVSHALGGDAANPATWGNKPLRFVKQRGNNFVYAFDFWMLRYQIYNPTPIADGLYQYFFRFSTDAGTTWYEAGKKDGRAHRFVVAPQQDCSLFPDNAPDTCPKAKQVGWAGNWGGKFNGNCDQVSGVPNPVVFTKSSLGSNCMVINAEVWVQGLTDVNGDPNAIKAEVETDISFSGGPLATPVTYALDYDGRVGNNYRYSWSQIHEHVGRADRGDYRYRFRFSADNGATWKVIGLNDTDQFRALQVRNDSLDVGGTQVCENVERWDSAFQHTPDCMNYEPASNHSARNCEFFVNSFGKGNWSHNGAYANWVEAYLSVKQQDGLLQNVGMLVHYKDNADPSTVKTRISLGREISANYWRTGFTFEQNAAYKFTIVDFAFFIDVQQQSGAVDRLWVSNSGANYTMENTFSVPGYVQGIGSGSVEYANESVVLFNQKKSCQ